MSLEKELHHEQRIINKLLEQPSRIAETITSPATPTTHGPTGGAEKDSSSSKDKNNLQQTSQKCMRRFPLSTESNSKGKGNNKPHCGNSSGNSSKLNQPEQANQQRKQSLL